MALSTLPALTNLDACGCFDVAFLPALTRLQSLDLDVSSSELATIIVAGLSSCTQLTDLSLRADDVTSAHMSQVLSRLPLLRSLGRSASRWSRCRSSPLVRTSRGLCTHCVSRAVGMPPSTRRISIIS